MASAAKQNKGKLTSEKIPWVSVAHSCTSPLSPDGLIAPPVLPPPPACRALCALKQTHFGAGGLGYMKSACSRLSSPQYSLSTHRFGHMSGSSGISCVIPVVPLLNAESVFLVKS